MKKKILLVDDHPLLRAGISQLFSSIDDFAVVGEADDGHGAVEQALKLNPDVVIMDITMPGLDGLDATRRIREAEPSAKILVLSMHHDGKLAVEALQAGAHGYMVKGSEGKELVKAVYEVLEGRRYVSQSLTGELIDGITNDNAGKPGPFASLSEKEYSVLELVVAGLSNKAMAASLGISISMIKKYKTRIMAKVSVDNTVSLIKKALQEGLFTDSD